MGNKPLFSVIVPIYGVEKYLRQCVDSILSQSFGDFELLLVDDGSQDSCPQICDEYASDKRVVVIHKKNGGLVSARKAGALKAKGKYILNVDGDDFVSADYFEKLSRSIERYKPDMICFGSFHFGDNVMVEHGAGAEPGIYDRRRIVDEIFPYLIENEFGRYFSPSIWSKAIKRDIYLKCQLEVDDSVKIGEDFACTRLAVYFAEKIVVLEDCLYYYRLNDNSMTRKKSVYDMTVPRVIGQLFEKNMDASLYDFHYQIYRNVVHYLFNAICTQFNRSEKYSIIKKNIKEVLSDSYYSDAISLCKYDRKYIKGKVASSALKYKLCFVLKILGSLAQYKKKKV